MGQHQWQYFDGEAWAACDVRVECTGGPKPPAVAVTGLPVALLDGVYEVRTRAVRWHHASPRPSLCGDSLWMAGGDSRD